MAHLSKASVQILNSEYNYMKTERSHMDALFDELRRTVMPNAGDFYLSDSNYRNAETPGEMYDSLPAWAANQLSNGIYSNMHPDDDRWMRLVPLGIPYQNLKKHQKEWLEEVMDVIYHNWSMPDTGFYSGLHEGDKEVVVFGTNVLYQEKDLKTKMLNYTPFPLGSCYIKENNFGMIDTVYRRFRWPLRRIIQEWGLENIPRPLREELEHSQKKDDILNKEHDMVHTVKPRKDIEFTIRGISQTKPFVSIYWMPSQHASVHEGTFEKFPYSVGRWDKMPGHVYGKMNLFTPLVMEEDGYLPPIEYVPGSIILKTPGTEDPKQLPVGGRFEITLDMMEQKRTQITRAFFIESLLREQKKARQTTFEVSDERQQMLQQLGPLFGRYKKEYLTPIIQNAYFHLNDMGLFPDIPQDFENVPLRVSYEGSAAKAQLATKADDLTRYIQDMVPLLQIKEDIVKRVNFDNVSEVMAEYRGVDARVLRSDDELAEMAEQAQAEQQAMAQTEMMANAAGAAKDVATAQSTLAQI
jgi:hypothetical protein